MRRRKNKNKKHVAKSKVQPLDQRAEVILFAEHAHLFYEHSEEILKNEKMFFTPVLFTNGLTITGVTGFEHPVLGVYIEWWNNYQDSKVVDDNGVILLIYHLSGSNLSGCNLCGLVSSDGKMTRRWIPYFITMCRRFATINRKYEEQKQNIGAYSLEEVIKLLSSRLIIKKNINFHRVKNTLLWLIGNYFLNLQFRL